MVNYKSLGDAIGMPDEHDREFIRRLLLDYERKHPGQIKFTLDTAKSDQWENDSAFRERSKFGLVDAQSSRRHLFELPASLMQLIERYYPTMFREKKHFAWFCKNFKELRLTEKY